jgi:NifU-like protein involved in Fe-S cluster formation
LVGAPACGDVMKLQFEVDDNGVIIDAKFKTFGCGSAIASSSVATEWLKGRKVDECLAIKVVVALSCYLLNNFLLHCTIPSH